MVELLVTPTKWFYVYKAQNVTNWKCAVQADVGKRIETD